MKNLLISFSGGETSAFMAQWLDRHAGDHGYENLLFAFANTGLENEETLEFTKRCDNEWGLKTIWVESVVHHGERKGTSYRCVDFNSASRDGEPFEEVIKKYGIPNKAYPHCTRELKERPLRALARDYFNGEPYHTAIGIRSDEFDRVSPKYRENGFIYPLIHAHMIPATKKHINFFWSNQSFRLDLKGYQGNCITCWKKSDKKLFQIAKENTGAFDFMKRMEASFGRVGSEFLNDPDASDRTFFRGKRSTSDILSQSESWEGVIIDDTQDINFQLDLFQNESCEVFSECRFEN